MLLILLLLSIPAITTSDLVTFIDAYCDEVCPYFKKMHTNKKIAYKEIEKNCNKGIKEVKKYCAELMKLDKIKRKYFRNDMETLTWNETCNEYC